VERNELLWEDAARWLDHGGRVDLTADTHLAPPALALFKRRGLPLTRCTLSSDAYGTLPRFDPSGRLVGYGVAQPGALLDCVRTLTHLRPSPSPSDGRASKGRPTSDADGPWALEDALALVTSNPAEALGLGNKGRLRLGADADVAMFDPGSLELRYVVAGGEVVMTPEWVRGGQFEWGAGIRPRKPRLT
jgi:beta-aspartyl-dipeptidase (metallo-type)